MVQREVEQVLARLDRVMSNYRADSEISRFNAARGAEWFPASAEFVEVVAAAAHVSRASGGAFDITIAPLVALWGFGPDQRPQHVPSATDLAAARARIGFARLEWRPDPPALRKHAPELTLDLSAIAIGYAADALAQALDRLGAKHYLIDVGGEMRARGRNADDVVWRVGIERPDGGPTDVAEVVALDNRSLGTSGDYRNYFEVDGVRYSHEIDPRTGMTARHDLASVTVVTDSAMHADAWATALMVLGAEEGMRVARASGIEALFIRRTPAGFVTTMTDGMARLMIAR
jgi:thiamine biosynthesis lipoprotein